MCGDTNWDDASQYCDAAQWDHGFHLMCSLRKLLPPPQMHTVSSQMLELFVLSEYSAIKQMFSITHVSALCSFRIPFPKNTIF